MIDTDKYESMRRLFLDFIDSAGDEVDEEAWKNKLTMLDELLAKVKRLQTIIHEIEHHNGVSAEVIAASSDALFMNELLAEVKRLRKENDELQAQRVQFSWIQESLTGRSSRYVGEEE